MISPYPAHRHAQRTYILSPHTRAASASTAHNPNVPENAIDPAARAADLIAVCKALRDVVPPLYGAEAELVDAPFVVLDSAQYARAEALGLAGRIGALQYDAVIYSGDRFVFARDCEDQRGAEIAFLLPARDLIGDVVDAVAWHPETGRIATLYGEVGTLGLHALSEPLRLEPPIVHETLLGWFLANAPGLFLIDERIAGRELDGVTIAADDLGSGDRLHARLAPHMRRRPKILVPLKADAA